jgi:hypothetical protein
MKAISVSIAAASLLLASPARAAPADDAACLIARLSEADAVAVVDGILAENSAAMVDRLTGPLQACAEGQDWTGARGEAASGYAAALLVRAVLHDRLSPRGVETEALDLWFARQSEEFRTTGFTTMSAAARDAAIATLVGNVVATEVMEREALSIGNYLGALSTIERIERGLPL